MNDDVRRTRDAWLKDARGRLTVQAAGVMAGAAVAALAVLTAPLTPVVLDTAGLGVLAEYPHPFKRSGLPRRSVVKS